MAVAVEVRILHLGPEFLANALILLTALHTAGTIAACAFKPLFYGLYHLFVFIQTNRHKTHFPFIIRSADRLPS